MSAARATLGESRRGCGTTLRRARTTAAADSSSTITITRMGASGTASIARAPRSDPAKPAANPSAARSRWTDS